MNALRRRDPRAADAACAESGQVLTRAWRSPKRMAHALDLSERRARQITTEGCGALMRTLEMTRAAERPEAIVSAIRIAAHHGRLLGMSEAARKQEHEDARREWLDAQNEVTKALVARDVTAEAKAAERAAEAGARLAAVATLIAEKQGQ